MKSYHGGISSPSFITIPQRILDSVKSVISPEHLDLLSTFSRDEGCKRALSAGDTIGRSSHAQSVRSAWDALTAVRPACWMAESMFEALFKSVEACQGTMNMERSKVGKGPIAEIQAGPAECSEAGTGSEAWLLVDTAGKTTQEEEVDSEDSHASEADSKVSEAVKRVVEDIFGAQCAMDLVKALHANEKLSTEEYDDNLETIISKEWYSALGFADDE